MTATSAADVAACPRRWALGAANYPDLWTGRGYPPRIQLAGLAGTVVHRAIETVTRELIRAGCASVLDPGASSVLRRLGGWTQIVSEAIDHVLARLVSNPRAIPILDNAARSLRAQVPDYRLRTQAMLSRVRTHGGGGASSGPVASAGRRFPLAPGSYPEVEVRAPIIGWKGKIDLLVLSDTACEITDFKTGERSDEHTSQILLYAYLWSRDDELNPDGRRATRLVLRYAKEDVEVPSPTSAELCDLEQELGHRREAARDLLSQRPPPARPSATNCEYCGVRQLCDAYWTADTQRALAEQATGSSFVDAEVTVDARHGPTSWDVTVRVAPSRLAGRAAVLRASSDLELQARQRIRLLGAAIIIDADEAQPVLLTLGTLSEVFRVDS